MTKRFFDAFLSLCSSEAGLKNVFHLYIIIIESSNIVAPVHSSRSFITRRMQELQHKANVVPYYKSHPASFSQSLTPSSMMGEASLKALCAAHNSKIHCIFRSNKQDHKLKQISKAFTEPVEVCHTRFMQWPVVYNLATLPRIGMFE